MKSATVALTGASGFIGRKVLQELAGSGRRVRALTRKAPPADGSAPPDLVTWVPGNLSNNQALAELVDGVDAIVHCAGAIKALNREQFFEINGAGTANLVAAAREQNRQIKFVHLSSLAAREPRLSNYAASKRLSEQAARAGRGKLDVVILRPPAVYGPGDMETLRIFRAAVNGFVPAPWNKNARMSLAHVGDAARAIMAALMLEETPDAPIEFDDGHAQGYTWPEIAAAAGAAIDGTPKIVRVPSPFLYLAGAAGSAFGAVSRRPTVLCLDKVPELLHPDWVTGRTPLPGYNPLWNIEKGFKDAVSWYASRGLLNSNSEVDLS